ncbi:carbohydrate sulfotransferase 9-like [Ylistrum balloti]|uniref:carbohydrate sulfotransferase 9-like n=1 Tax=Ylistrum balloti TaxID=509963 RepID=UPI0029058C03|nr:carbohydrate sulfotransferase 9-like [Ylistrum balloti]
MGSVRYRCVVTAGISVILLCCFYMFGHYYNDDKHMVLKENQISGHHIAYDTGLKDTWNDRIHHLQKGCHQSGKKDKYKIKYQQTPGIFFQSMKLNISVCKVAKAGSTFWAIVFLIVEKGMAASKAFSIPRHKIHSMSGGLTKRLPTEHEQLKTNGVVVSRDPYSRLFSAFIDKYYLLRFVQNAKSLAKSLGKGFFMTEVGKCGYNVSFQDFVDSVTTTALQGRGINRHWSPVYTMCRVCDVEYQYVIQQETLTRDTEYIINQLEISNETKTTLTRMFHGSGTNKTMAGVIETMWSAIDGPAMRACCSNKLAYFMKMWEGFKIQGYIRTNIAFPLSAFQGKNSVNVKNITNAVLKAMSTNPLSSTERKTQRRQALVDAYVGMPKRIISQVQEMYKMDFYLFGYDVNPPS